MVEVPTLYLQGQAKCYKKQLQLFSSHSVVHLYAISDCNLYIIEMVLIQICQFLKTSVPQMMSPETRDAASCIILVFIFLTMSLSFHPHF